MKRTFCARHRRKDGVVYKARVTACCVEITGEPMVMSIIMDADNSARIEEWLQESYQRFHQIYTHMAVGIAQISLDFIIEDVNPAYCKMLGYTKKELIGKSLKEITHPETLEKNLRKQSSLASGEIDHYRMEKKLIHKTGKTVYGILDATLIKNAGGRPIYFLGAVSDISDLKKIEKEMIAGKQLLEGVFDSIEDVIGVMLPDRTIVQYNRAGYELFGIDEAQAKGKKCYELMGQIRPCRLCPANKADRTGTLESIEKHIPELGKVFYCTSNPILDDQGAIKLIIKQLTDITEKKKMDEELRQSQKMESIGRLAGGIAHDFNNMLFIILANTQIMLNDPSQSAIKNLEQIKNAAERSSQLTNQLLSFARKQTVSPKPINLNRAIENTVRMLTRLIGDGIELSWKPGKDIWTVNIDPAQFHQILTNLCINAKDAIGGIGTIIIKTQNTSIAPGDCNPITGLEPGDYVMMSVTDNGCGMDKKTLDFLFEPFFTTKGTGKGTGLGLATVYGIVKQNNGDIDVSSEPEQGTVFTIYLPKVDKQTSYKKHGIKETNSRPGNETILIVEDEQAVIEATATLLEHLGYTVLTASTPLEAIKLVARSKKDDIQLLITDVIMPEMNGRDLSEKIMSVLPGIKCLYMSGYPADVITPHGVLDKGLHFLSKPFLMQDISTKLCEIFDKE